MEAAIDEPLADAERKALARCRHAVLGVDRPLRLDCGVELGPYRVAYQTYGTLNADKSNAVLICHALTLDQFVAEEHPVTGKEGWWESLVGPGKVLDPARYFIICVNVLVWRSAPCLSCTSLRITSSGATTHPRRRPGASVFDRLPR